MKSEEFFINRSILQKKYESDLKDLHKKYVESNNTIKIGDIITDHWHTIKVDKIGATLSGTYSSLPQCIYFGRRYTKKGQPTKRDERSQIYQRNIVK